jgi:hypothetical protein
MRALAIRAVAGVVVLIGALVAQAFAADAPREVHGSSDRYAGSGIALAWGVLRGASEDATVVVVRIVADASAFRAIAVTGVDPFSGGSKPLLAPTSTSAPVEFRSPRSRFADLPRTEFRFFASDTPGDAPALVVYYLGIPDTTPEFADAGKLAAHLTQRTAAPGSPAQEKSR